MSRFPGEGARSPGSAGAEHTSAAEEFLFHQESQVEGVRQSIAENHLEVVIAGAPDLNGVFLGKRVPGVRFAERPLASVGMGDIFWIFDTEQNLIPAPSDSDGWFPSWAQGFGNVDVYPDLSSFRVVPWLDRTGLVLCEHFFTDGRAINIAPRHILRRVAQRAESIGTVKFAAEIEFYLLRETEESLEEKGYSVSALRTLDRRLGVWRISQATTDESITRPLASNLETFGIPIEYWNPEGGPGQYEFNVVYMDLPEAADGAFLFKHAIREIATQHGLTASFMAKTFPSHDGSSCHIHQSLWNGNQNLFWADEKEGNLSDLARWYIGGSLAALPELMLLLAPNMNSYKRLVPQSGAGTTATWGYENRTAALRALNHDPKGCRIENRVGGADVNPYLAMAACLAGGLHGIERGLAPPIPRASDAYSDPSATELPNSLDQAIAAFETSAVAKDFFGEDFVRFYARTRKWELEQFRANVTDWEVRRYLPFL